MKDEITKVVEVGIIGVDSAMCWIGDPCYVLPDGQKNNPGRDWDAFCKAMFTDATSREGIRLFERGIGVCVMTPHGDGGYPVSATIKDGRITSVTVQFEPDDDDD